MVLEATWQFTSRPSLGVGWWLVCGSLAGLLGILCDGDTRFSGVHRQLAERWGR